MTDEPHPTDRPAAPADPGGPVPGPDGPGAADARRHAEERRTERQVWWYLAYFLFGIHLVAFVMIFAVRHGK
ncbi:hypothetical protein ACSMX9_10990 [Streptomyces sp. LE64]|uniref:hypothetical protein n=1 Tax=Streptomyces sp. LE64 TaxID=3448653 RepID=UPI0040422777